MAAALIRMSSTTLEELNLVRLIEPDPKGISNIDIVHRLECLHGSYNSRVPSLYDMEITTKAKHKVEFNLPNVWRLAVR